MLVYPADLSSRGFSTEVRFCLHYKKNLLEYRHSDFTLRFPKVSIFEGDGLMDEMVFATFLILLSDAWDEVISEVNLVELLYDGVADAANLRTEDGQVICVTKGTASKVFARQTGGNVRRDIRKHASDPKVITSIEEYFKKKVLTHILPARKPDLIGGLKKVIEKDDVVTDKERFLKYADISTIAKFLSEIYLYVLTRNNVRQKGEKRLTGQDLEDYKHHALEDIPIPVKIGTSERRYTDALLEVYAQVTGQKKFTKKDLEKEENAEYAEHMAEQRNYFFAAEAVRRGTRDIYSEDDEDQFCVLENEVFEGIKETWRDHYKNGLVRLSNIFKEIPKIDISKCWLRRDTDWIGNAQRKGVCHFLVKDEFLKGWIKADDDQNI